MSSVENATHSAFGHLQAESPNEGGYINLELKSLPRCRTPRVLLVGRCQS